MHSVVSAVTRPVYYICYSSQAGLLSNWISTLFFTGILIIFEDVFVTFFKIQNLTFFEQTCKKR